MARVHYDYLDTPIGLLLLATDGDAVVEIGFPSGKGARRHSPDWERNERKVREVARQLQEYFAGQRRSFDLPLAPAGTEFQLRVWKALLEIPYGETISYGELARRTGNAAAARAVGAANGRNPIPVIIPCHRVIGGNGGLTGFGGGLHAKQMLLELERAHMAPGLDLEENR